MCFPPFEYINEYSPTISMVYFIPCDEGAGSWKKLTPRKTYIVCGFVDVWVFL